jgi:hypothetical protein
MDKIDSLISLQAKEFVKLCRQYFEYLETLPDKNISDFWLMQLQLLPKIYSGLYKLPQIKDYYSSEVEKFVTESDYNKTYLNLVAFIGTVDRYADFNDLGHPGAAKMVETSLSETLTDIYQELKDFVLLYETGTVENMNDSIADCLDTFGRYWGVKLLSATRIIHVNLYQQRYADAKKSKQMDDDDDEELDETYESIDEDDDEMEVVDEEDIFDDEME